MKNKNILLFILGLVVLAAFVALFIIDKNKKSNKIDRSLAASGSLTTVDNNFDFKTISMKNGKVSHKFEIKNNSNEPVKIAKIYTSCMCTSAYLENGNNRLGPFGMSGHTFIPSINEIINPGQTVSVEAIFDPAAHGPQGTGLIKRLVYIETNSSITPQLELAFEANVVL